MRLRRPVIAAVVALGALVLTGSAQACSCAPTSRGEAMRAADAAIAGRLLKVVPLNRVRAVYRYRVERVLKRGAGIRRDGTIEVRSARSASACGLPTRIGRRYRLLLVRQRGAWTGSACGLLDRQRLCANG